MEAQLRSSNRTFWDLEGSVSISDVLRTALFSLRCCSWWTHSPSFRVMSPIVMRSTAAFTLHIQLFFQLLVFFELILLRMLLSLGIATSITSFF